MAGKTQRQSIMYVDARPFKAGYAQAFQSRTGADRFATRRQIAKAYLAGCSPKELAGEYGISVQKVIAIAQWYDRERMRARTLAKIAATPKPEPKPEAVIAPIEAMADAETYTVEKRYSDSRTTRITLPLLSIQRAKEAA